MKSECNSVERQPLQQSEYTRTKLQAPARLLDRSYRTQRLPAWQGQYRRRCELTLLRQAEARGRQQVLDELRLLEHGQLKTHVLAVQRCLAQARATEASELRARWLDESQRQAQRLLDVVVQLHQSVGSSALPDDLEQTVADVARSLVVAYPHCACQVEVIGQRLPIGAQIQRALILVLYNALSNAYRHGSPTRIGVQLQYAPDALILVVCDDGCGMALDASDWVGRGLRDMRALVARHGGTLRISSAPGAGTELRAFFPLDEQRYT